MAINKVVSVRYFAERPLELCNSCTSEKTCNDAPLLHEHDDGAGYECEYYEPKEANDGRD